LNLILKAIVFIAIIVVGVGTFKWLMSTKPEPVIQEKPEKRWLVNVVSAEFQSISPEVRLYGRVETPRDASLKAAVQADVAEVLVLEGSVVNKGDLLLKLDDADVQLTLLQREANLAAVKAQIDSEYQRYKRDKGLLANQQTLLELADKAVARANKLQQSKLTSQANLDDALASQEQQRLNLKQLEFDIEQHSVRLDQLKAELKAAEAQLAQVQLDLTRTEIRSPFDGRVASLSVAEGDRIRVGDNLISVYDLSELEVRAQIPGRYIGGVKRMMQSSNALTATSELYDQTLTLELARLSGEVNAESGGIDGLFRLVDDNMQLPLGTFMTLTFKLAEQDEVLMVPYAALYGLDRVYVVSDGHMKSVTIERVGEMTYQDKNWILIRTDELKNGDQIITTQLPNAMTGLAVEVVSEP
jgi:RND family efflux transporter MFP subunit